ncbi:ABC transporter substrate-binding protein [Microcella sp.]|uniref:ABC transporter substrate-binding protein n=1 Tax=Microcella sp. TaxID=1913979 RepID=UPI00391A8C43
MRRTADARRSHHRRAARLALPAALAVSALVLAGCTAEPEPMPVPTEPAPSPTPFREVAPSGDGQLVIGTLLPTDGDTAGVAAAQIAAVEVAVRELNDNGGVLDEIVTVVHRNSGTEPGDELESAFADLVDRGVDVVIGPFTDALVEQTLPLAAEAGVALISTGATGALEGADEGYFARVVPTDRLQGVALAQGAIADGAASIAVVASDDAYGEAVADGVADAADAAGLDEPTVVTVSSSSAAGVAAAADADAVIVATSTALADITAGMLDDLLGAGLSPASLWLASAAAADYSGSLDAGALEGARGALLGAEADDAFVERLLFADPFLGGFRWAPEAYDAVLLAALAATVIGDDGGASIIAGLPQVSREGAPCTSYGECLQFLIDEPDAGLNYQGLSGPLGLRVDGDVDEAAFGLGVYTDENRPVRDGNLLTN